MHSDKIIKYLPDISNYNPDKIGNNVGIVADVETTGVEDNAEIIQFCAIPFKFSDDLFITEILKPIVLWNEPKTPISEEITELTGITNDMVKGKKIYSGEVMQILSNKEIVITHNAKFDRLHLERQFSIPDVLWGCSMRDINWKAQKINSLVQEYIAFCYGFWYEAHNAEEDTKALIHILAQKNNFQELMSKVYEPSWKIILKDTKYEEKEILKSKKFYWNSEDKTWEKSGVTDLTEMKNWLNGNLSTFLVKKEKENILKRYKKI